MSGVLHVSCCALGAVAPIRAQRSCSTVTSASARAGALQGAAQIAPGPTRAATPWPILQCINKVKGGPRQPSFPSLIDCWVGCGKERVLEDEKPPHSW